MATKHKKTYRYICGIGGHIDGWQNRIAVQRHDLAGGAGVEGPGAGIGGFAIRTLDLDPSKVNVHGGAIALGHPIGASGARVLTTLVYALRARKARYGVASLCIGGGMGIAMVIEAL